jgi:hypothetical protein
MSVEWVSGWSLNPHSPHHHRASAFDVGRAVVGASEFILINMRQREFDQLRVFRIVLAMERTP